MNRRGSVLIIALWTLALLTTFAVYIGVGVQQRILMVQRIESRHKLYLAASSGIRKAIAMINIAQQKEKQPLANPTMKPFLMDNPKDFFGIDLGGVTVEVGEDAGVVGEVAVGERDEDRHRQIFDFGIERGFDHIHLGGEGNGIDAE